MRVGIFKSVKASIPKETELDKIAYIMQFSQSIKTPPFKDDELDKLKEYLIPRIEKLMKLWPTSENEIDLKDWKIVYK